jgi:phosphoribosylaminoimidazole (AIR) synthetase
MYRTFNMGVGLRVVVSGPDLGVRRQFTRGGFRTQDLGTARHERGVIVNKLRLV